MCYCDPPQIINLVVLISIVKPAGNLSRTVKCKCVCNIWIRPLIKLVACADRTVLCAGYVLVCCVLIIVVIYAVFIK
jgi:hypothetical protein